VSRKKIKNRILPFSGKWIKLEDIMLNKISYMQKEKDHKWNCHSEAHHFVLLRPINKKDAFGFTSQWVCI
jgi:hypothetical protein